MVSLGNTQRLSYLPIMHSNTHLDQHWQEVLDQEIFSSAVANERVMSRFAVFVGR